ncbi:MAG: plastocyanin/azurin family copper-binding protein [Nitriliruptorales bacterium]|nr:plastocyanin/azurin family copper-binding protein [Nitriliruptorales bacterium]
MPQTRLLLPLLLLVAGVLGLPTTAGAADVTVRLLDNEFSPSEVTIVVGDTVTWVWAGANRHSVRSNDGGFGSHADCGPLNQANCGGPGSTFQHTFGETGSFTVRCEVHTLGGMVSTVTVTQAPAPTQPPTTAPTPEPTAPEPSPTASPEPTPSESDPQAQPEPSAPAVTVPDATPSPSSAPTADPTADPTTDIEFEPFVEEPVIPTPSETPDVVIAAPAGASTLARALGIVMALGALGLWAGLFGRLVLFADPWDGSPTA